MASASPCTVSRLRGRDSYSHHSLGVDLGTDLEKSPPAAGYMGYMGYMGYTEGRPAGYMGYVGYVGYRGIPGATPVSTCLCPALLQGINQQQTEPGAG